MENNSFRKYAHELVDWIADYYENIEQYPVKSRVEPGWVKQHLPDRSPENGEQFEAIFKDFVSYILPGITHWQNPSFFAYFNANSSFPSLLGEFLTAALGAQCMIWDTSPAAAELEEKVMDWLKEMLKLPNEWHGVIQDTASTATLCALITAREKKSGFGINEKGYSSDQRFTIYCSTEAHSSIEKDVKIAGFGRENLRKIPVDDNWGMDPGALEQQIKSDIQNGFRPLCVVAALGTTGVLAFDPMKEIGEICKKHDIWLHVDAAYAGSAAVLPECKWIHDHIEFADSYVFNPHKWMFVNFDCSAYFVKDKEALIRTFEILPEYLKTKHESRVNNYRDWGIQLGRRFRALKLWFVLRSFGVEGIQRKYRLHLELAKYFEERISNSENFVITAPNKLNLVCFRANLPDRSLDELNQLNHQLMDQINSDGRAYLTHTKLNGVFMLRASIGQTNVEKKHVDQLWHLLNHYLKEILNQKA
ncbi:MAG TPA: aspartate aminotransferase family protein [Cytophagales bacterium]|jgi:aromatic-L-amino-acid decarboxylase|nr:aspartate aminotransferase family protein [Cytophagales bacterium]